MAGIAPTASPTVFISLISGKIVDQSTQQHGLWIDAWQTYQHSHHVSDTIADTIDNARKLYAQKLMGPHTFGQFIIAASDIRDIMMGQYIYTTTKNDYFIMAGLDTNNNVIATGMPYDDTVNGMLNLINGNVYRRNNSQPVNSGYIDQLTTYQQMHGPLRKDLLDAIVSAQKKYKEVVQQPSQEQKILPINKPSEQTIAPVSSSPVSNKITFGPPSKPSNSLTQRQQDATDGWN